MLVEDERQAIGIGSLLVRRLLLHAGESEVSAVVADIGRGNDRILLALRELEPRGIVRQPDGWQVELDPWTSLRELACKARSERGW